MVIMTNNHELRVQRWANIIQDEIKRALPLSDVKTVMTVGEFLYDKQLIKSSTDAFFNRYSDGDYYALKAYEKMSLMQLGIYWVDALYLQRMFTKKVLLSVSIETVAMPYKTVKTRYFDKLVISGSEVYKKKKIARTIRTRVSIHEWFEEKRVFKRQWGTLAQWDETIKGE